MEKYNSFIQIPYEYSINLKLNVSLNEYCNFVIFSHENYSNELSCSASAKSVVQSRLVSHLSFISYLNLGFYFWWTTVPSLSAATSWWWTLSACNFKSSSIILKCFDQKTIKRINNIACLVIFHIYSRKYSETFPLIPNTLIMRRDNVCKLTN